MSARREVWITGVGLLTCLGEGMEANWQRLERGDPPPYDDKTFAPYIVHPLPAMSFDKQIPKKADQRQMELWQRAGTYAAGLALSDAGIAGKPDLLDRTDMIVAAGGGERDVAADNAILAGVRKANRPDVFLNERLMSDLRPTLFLAQLPNLLAGNISLVHGVVGSSRTFMGEEAAGVDSVRVAQARVASGQSELTLVGGAYNGARWDVLLAFELGHVLLQGQIRAGLGSRAQRRHRLCDHGGVFGAGKPRTRASARRKTAGAAFRNPFRPQFAASPARPRRRCAGNGRRSPARSIGRMPASFPAPAGSSPRPRRNAARSRNLAFPFAIPVRISGMGSRPSFWPIWGSPAPRSSTASCSRRPAAAIPAIVPPGCRRLSSPASAIGAAKGLALVERVG